MAQVRPACAGQASSMSCRTAGVLSQRSRKPAITMAGSSTAGSLRPSTAKKAVALQPGRQPAVLALAARTF